jgi:hypothetical protein
MGYTLRFGGSGLPEATIEVGWAHENLGHSAADGARGRLQQRGSDAMIRVLALVGVVAIVAGILLGSPGLRRVLIGLGVLAVAYAVLKLTGVIDWAFPSRGG